MFAAPARAEAQPVQEAPWFRDATKEYGDIGGGPPAFADLDGPHLRLDSNTQYPT